MRFEALRLAGFVWVLAACTPQLDEKEAINTLLQDKGVLAGYELGDSWETIKKEHDPKLKVREEGKIRQLRRDLTALGSSGMGKNGYFITFSVDDQGKVVEISATIAGEKANAVTVRSLLEEVLAHFDKKNDNRSCQKVPGAEGNSTACSWRSDGKRPTVRVTYYEHTDPVKGAIEIRVGAAGTY